MAEPLVRVSRGGWVRYESPDLPVWVYVRFVPDAHGEPRPRLRARDVFVAALDDAVIDATMMGSVPIREIEAIVNGSGDVAKAVRRRLGHQVEDVRQWFTRNVRPGAIAPSPTRRLRLKIPSRRPYGDDFYESLAELYSQEAARTSAPGALIAGENDVPVRTVQGWIREARKRGFLPSGSAGRAG